MKTQFATFAAALAFWAAVANNAPAQFSGPSPAGQWDCLVSGNGQQGIAFITFYDNLEGPEARTFSGYQVLTFEMKNPSDDLEGRNLGGGVGRYPSVNTKPGLTNVFGYGDFHGTWEFDSTGQVIGSYIQVTEKQSGTGGTNETASVTNSVTFVTNSVSFRAKVVTGKRLTMTCSTANGKLVYKGVVLNPLPEIDGHWYGSKQQNDQSFVEFFDLLSSEAEFPNLYELVGTGPSYPMTGVCLRSAQGKIAFGIEEGSTNAVLRTSIGSFSSSSKAYKAKTKGVADPKDAIKFDAVLTPSK